MNGYGLAGFAGGLGQGLNTGLQLGKAVRAGKERRMAKRAGEEATEKRNVAIEGLMADSSINYSDAGPVQPGERFEIDGQTYDDQGAARQAAEGNVADTMTYYRKFAVPKMTEYYMQAGEPEKAQAWQEWSEKQEQKVGMKKWAEAYSAGLRGDWNKVGDYVFDQYKDDDDGITPISKNPVKDEEGNITAFEVKLKNDASGEEYTQTVGAEDLLRIGMTNYSPPELFEKAYAQDQAAMEARREAAADELDFRREVSLSDRKAGQAMERDRLNDQRQTERAIMLKEMEQALGGDAKANAKIRKLREFGYSEDFIRDTMPAILGIGQYKKKASPDEVARMLHGDLVDTDPYINGKAYSSMTQSEQKKIIRDQMKMLSDIATESSGPSPAPRGLDGSTGGAPDPGLFWTPRQ